MRISGFFLVILCLIEGHSSFNVRKARQVRIQFGDEVFEHNEAGRQIQTRPPPTHPTLPSPPRSILNPRPTAPSSGARCTTTDGKPGTCVIFHRCSVSFFSSFNSGACRTSGSVPLVCCPSRVDSPAQKPPIRPSPETTPRPVSTPKPNLTPVSGETSDLFPQDCGVTRGTSLRVVGGRESDVGTWPWMAAIYIVFEGKSTFHCAGTIINNRYVITAAHCIEFQDGTLLKANELIVRLGDLHLKSDSDGLKPIEIRVSEVIGHNNFNSRTYLNDIALLRLDSIIQYTDVIKPICVPYDAPSITNQDLTGKKGIVTGWGKTEFQSAEFSDTLHEALLPIWSNKDCDQSYRGQRISQEYICSGHIDGGEDACQGDSGGPFMVPENNTGKMFLVGIVSFGFECARPNFPGVYTRVSMYTKWIGDNMKS